MQYFKKKPNPLVSKAVIAMLTTGLISGNSFAADGDPDPVPTTYTDVSVPAFISWNTDNIEILDGATAATPKSHVYPTAAKNDPNGSVAAVFWQLDNDSGRSPGVQVVTDDFNVPTNNCIMASGEMDSADFPGTVVPKTCSDAEGSSKRYFLEVTQADKPVDLVFDLGKKDIRYKGVKDPSTDAGVELQEFRDTYGIGRIYRLIQKVINNTDKRIANYKFEIGTGVSDNFQALTFEEHGVAFEMRPLVPREFFEGETGAPDIKVWDPLRFATVSPKMFDDGSRARFNPGFLDHAPAGFLPPQFPSEGVEKSQMIESGLTLVDGKIGSLTPNYFNMINTQAVGAGLTGNMFGYHLPDSLIPTVIGEYNTNEVGGESDAIVAIWDGNDWRSGRAGLDGDPLTTADNFAVIPESQLTQWAAKPLGLDIPGELPEDLVRYEGLLSDDLSGLNTDVYIYIGDKLLDETGALTIDSITVRLTAESVDDVIGDVPGSEDPTWVEMGKEAPELSSYMTKTGEPVAINDVATTVEVAPVTVAILKNDLLDGELLTPAQITAATITITTPAANGTATINVDQGIDYTAAAAFVGTDMISYTVTLPDTQLGALPGDVVVSNVATFMVTVDAAPIPDAPTAGNDSAETFKNTSITLNVLENDELNKDDPTSVVVSIDNAALNGVATVAADNTIVYTPQTSFVGFERFTYIVTVDDKVSNSALVTIRVDEPIVDPVVPPADDSEMSSSSSSGCSVGGANSPFDPMLPGMFILALAGLLLRRRKVSL